MRSREIEIDKATVSRVEDISKKKVMSMAQVATSWVLRQEGLNPIMGLGSQERSD